MQLRILKKLVIKFCFQVFLCEEIKLLMDDSHYFHTKLHSDINISKQPFSEDFFYSTQKKNPTLSYC